MNFEENQKRQTIRVIITEALMVFAVIVLVAVLVMIVSGYWVNQDLTIRRQGLLQVSSTPTNAAISVDGETGLFQRTNSSKMVATGDHVVSLSKDGYDTWSKKVNIKEGLLYRLHYPRLFLLERSSEKILTFENITATTVSPNRETMLVMNNTTKWSLFNLDDDVLKESIVDVSEVFPGATIATGATSGLINNEIVSYVWNEDNTKILFEILNNGQPAWIMMDLKNPSKSVNISGSFGLNISAIKMFDNSGDNLLIVEDGNLRKINIVSQTISRILAKDVVSYDFYKNEIVYVSRKSDGVVVGNLKNIDSEPVEFLHYDDEKIWIALSLFYEDKFLTIADGEKIAVYKWKTPSSMKGDDFLENVLEEEISFVPQKFYRGHGGEFVVFSDGDKIATLDMESLAIVEYEVETEKIGWLDDDMIFVVDDGDLIVYDYDGYNRRVIANNVSSRYDVIISKNEKWLYYFSDGNLIKENLLPN